MGRDSGKRSLKICAHRTLTFSVVLLFLPLLSIPTGPARAQLHRQLTPEITSSPDFYARFIEDRDQISIIEVAGDYSKLKSDGSSNWEPRSLVAQEFYLDHADNYDFLIVFSTFEFDTADPEGGDALAFHFGIQNQVEGIGPPLFDNTAVFGSQ